MAAADPPWLPTLITKDAGHAATLARRHILPLQLISVSSPTSSLSACCNYSSYQCCFPLAWSTSSEAFPAAVWQMSGAFFPPWERTTQEAIFNYYPLLHLRGRLRLAGRQIRGN